MLKVSAKSLCVSAQGYPPLCPVFTTARSTVRVPDPPLPDPEAANEGVIMAKEIPPTRPMNASDRRVFELLNSRIIVVRSPFGCRFDSGAIFSSSDGGEPRRNGAFSSHRPVIFDCR